MIITINNNIKNKVHASIPRYVINDFLKWANNGGFNFNNRFYNSISLETACYIFLYYCATNCSYTDLEKFTGLPHNNCKQVLGLCRSSWYDWSLTKVVPLRLRDRKRIRFENELTGFFKHATMLVDSRDIPTVKRDERRKKSKYHSYKLNKHGVKIQFFISFNNKFLQVMGPFSPSIYDSDCIGKRVKTIKNVFSKDDKILADNHYGSIKKYLKHPEFITRYTETKRTRDDDQKMHYNKQHKRERAKVETAIADLSNRFAVLKTGYRRKKSEPVFQLSNISAGIHNCILDNKH